MSKTNLYKLFPLVFVFLWSCNQVTEVKEALTNDVSHNTFVGSSECMNCHKDQFEKWEGSHHQKSMLPADSSSVLASFQNDEYKTKIENFRFFQKDGKYWVEVKDGVSNQLLDVKFTFGFTPLQQYIVETKPGQFQCLKVAWDSEKSQWFELQGDLDVHKDEWLHWSKGAMNWNSMCADCHSTNLHKNYNPKTQQYNTTYSEINVACEACHGPSSNHVNHYKEDKGGTLPPLLALTDLDSKQLVDQCARCHSRRVQLTSHFDFEGSFLDHYSPDLLVSSVYEPDGQILDEDYVYGSFVQSKMYHNDVSCKDCHDVHSLKLKKEGNNLCLQCHENTYNSESHHFHPVDSEAGQCINCHMTGKLYMTNDFRRDHSFRIPRPDQSMKFGTPNACVGCHKDKTDEWAAEAIKKHYGAERTDHFSDHLLAGFNGDKEALQHLIQNHKYPWIARATAVQQYGSFVATEQDLQFIKKYLKDSSALVRSQAAQLLGNFSDQESVKDLKPLLNDSVRSVRITAAQPLYRFGILDSSQAKEEYQTMQHENMEFASGQFNYGADQEMRGNLTEAISAYRRAIEIDNYYNPARMNLALLLYKNGSVEEVENLYKKVIEQEPRYANAYYMLGLFYNEQKNVKQAIENLELACRYDFTNRRAYYNYVLLLHNDKQHEKVISIALASRVLHSQFPEMEYIKLLSEIELGKIEEAKKTCARLIQLDPDNAQYQQIMLQLSQK